MRGGGRCIFSRLGSRARLLALNREARGGQPRERSRVAAKALALWLSSAIQPHIGDDSDDGDEDYYYSDSPSDKMLELRSDGNEWVILDQFLKQPRMEHVSFPITDEVENNLRKKYCLEDK